MIKRKKGGVVRRVGTEGDGRCHEGSRRKKRRRREREREGGEDMD